jgi:mRNA-degrading endonuclease toxin of MazEF toxin-antitoxin module
MARGSLGQQLARIVGRAARDGASQWLRGRGRPSGNGARPSTGTGPAAPPLAGYPGDFEGTPDITYSPAHDGDPDPGEIVWTWVPFEEDHSRGKDRPVLVIGRDDAWLLGLMLTSQDHDRDAAQEARHGREWVDIGTGSWDRQGRPSEARVDRIVRLDPARVRREGAVLSRERFDEVAAAVRAAH